MGTATSGGVECARIKTKKRDSCHSRSPCQSRKSGNPVASRNIVILDSRFRGNDRGGGLKNQKRELCNPRHSRRENLLLPKKQTENRKKAKTPAQEGGDDAVKDGNAAAAANGNADTVADAATVTTTATPDSPPATEAAAESKSAQESELEEAKREAAESRELLLRKAAELENYRRRIGRELENAVNNEMESFALAMCEVRDCIQAATDADDNATESATESTPPPANETENEKTKTLREGIALTLRKMDSALQAAKILPVHPDRGLVFDPELHQAVATEESQNADPNAVLRVLQTGYTLNNRLIRPAQVIVCKPPSQQQQQAEDETPEKTK